MCNKKGGTHSNKNYHPTLWFTSTLQSILANCFGFTAHNFTVLLHFHYLCFHMQQGAVSNKKKALINQLYTTCNDIKRHIFPTGVGGDQN